MPQDTSFFLPFRTQDNPDTDRAREHHIDWVRRFDLVRSDVAIQRYRDWLLTDLAAYAYPDVKGDDLDLVTDAVCLGFPLDDQFDGELGWQPERVARLSEELAAIAYREPGAAPLLDAPITRAYVDVWERQARGMSATWRRRAAGNWARFFRAYVAESRNKRDQVVLNEPEYVTLRRLAVGTHSCFDLVERAHHFELSPEVYDSDECAVLRECAGDVIFLCNDVHSVERERARHDPHNIVLIRERTTRCTQTRAVEQVRDMVRERVERFLAVEERLPELCEKWRLDRRASADLRTYVDGLRYWMIGNQLWGVASARYATENSALDFIEDVTRPQTD